MSEFACLLIGVLLSVIFIPSSTYPKTIEEAANACELNGGLARISNTFPSGDLAICKNGGRFQLGNKEESK